MMTSASRPRRLLSPLFLVTAAILLVGAIGLRPGLAALAKYYSKKPITPVLSLLEFDVHALPSFEYVPPST